MRVEVLYVKYNMIGSKIYFNNLKNLSNFGSKIIFLFTILDPIHRKKPCKAPNEQTHPQKILPRKMPENNVRMKRMIFETVVLDKKDFEAKNLYKVSIPPNGQMKSTEGK